MMYLSLLRADLPALADVLETQGLVDVFAQTPNQFETFKQALLKLPR